MAKAVITNIVKKCRFLHNEMTQQELANIIGCTRQTINALEQGKYVPSLSLAFKLSRLFNISIEEIFHYQELEESE